MHGSAAGSASGLTAWTARCASFCRKAACRRSIRPGGRLQIPVQTRNCFAHLKQPFDKRRRAVSFACRRISTMRNSRRRSFLNSAACLVAGSRGGARGDNNMARIPRSDILARFHAMKKRGETIIGAGAGTGLSAKGEEKGGADLIVIYNSGRYRMAGRGSLAGMLAYGDANAIVVEMAREVLPVVQRTPVLAGVNGTDPFRQMDVFLREIKALGFSGVQNFPTVGLIDGTFRANLEETGMGYGGEVEMIAKAPARDLLTTPYVFNPAEAEAMARAGADIIVCHLGLTTGGAI